MNDFYSALESRRTIYGIGNQEVVPPARLREILEFCVRKSPTAFNGQQERIMLMLGKNHARVWEIALEKLRAIVPAESFDETEKRIAAFAAGYGTILYFEDTSITKGLQEKFPTYSANFPFWAAQAGGMLKAAVWNAFSFEGMGASIQHYSELIEDDVRSEFGVNPDWKLTAQMPFGNPTAPPDHKDIIPPSERVLVLN